MVQSLFMSLKVTDKIAPSPNTKLRLLLSYFHCLVEPLRVDSVPVFRPKWNRQYSLLSTISTLLENVNRIEKVKRKESRYTLQKTLLQGQLVKHKFMTQTMINYLNRSCYRILLCLPLSSKAKGGNVYYSLSLGTVNKKIKTLLQKIKKQLPYVLNDISIIKERNNKHRCLYNRP